MPVNSYDIGDAVELRATFEVAGVGFDPPVVRFLVLDPIGNLTTFVYGTDPEIEKVIDGTYSMITFPSTGGMEAYRIEAEDDGDEARSGAEEAQFYVRRSAIVNGVGGSGSGGGGFDGGTP